MRIKCYLLSNKSSGPCRLRSEVNNVSPPTPAERVTPPTPVVDPPTIITLFNLSKMVVENEKWLDLIKKWLLKMSPHSLGS